MSFGLTQVKAFTFPDTTQIDENVDINSLTFYDEIMFKTQIVTDIPFTRYDDLDLSVRYISLPKYSMPLGMGDNDYSTDIFGTHPNMFYFLNPNRSSDLGTYLYIFNKYVGEFPFPSSVVNDNTDVTVNYFFRSSTNSDATVTTTAKYWASFMTEDAPIDAFTFTNNLVNLTNEPLVFGIQNPDTYYLRYLIVKGDTSHLLYPAKLDNKVGMYDTATKKFYYITDSSQYVLGNVTIAPDVPEQPSEPTAPDYTDKFNEVNQNLNNINNSINQTNQNLEDINNSITDGNVSNSVILQPDVPDDISGVESGVNNIFTDIMNAFINIDTTQNLVLPIPFTNQSITISGSYTRDMLTSVNATWLLTFINLFWWYLISRFIIKDVLKTVDHIEEGNLDKVENFNIKGDML